MQETTRKRNDFLFKQRLGGIGLIKILAYHLIGEPKKSGDLQERMYVSTENFINQLNFLIENGYKILSLNEAEKHIMLKAIIRKI